MAITSYPPSSKYRSEHERIYGKKDKTDGDEEAQACVHKVYKLKCKDCGADCGESENAEVAP